MSSETAEIYLRQLAEARLRRLAAGTTTAADCAARVDAVAAAFTRTGLLGDTIADAITGELRLALAVRSPERDTPLHRGQRATVSTFRSFGGGGRVYAGAMTPPPGRGTPAPPAAGATTADGEEPPRAPDVVPVGKVLRVREDGADEDIYLLTYIAARGRAWLSVAARTSETPVSRLHAPPAGTRGPGAQRARPSTFAGRGMSAVDANGQRYRLGFSGGGGTWYLGRLTLTPVPPPGLEWLDITCGGQTVRADLTARAAEVTALVTPVAASRAEGYLLRRAEILLSHPALAAAEAAAMASVVPALRAVGALSATSPVPGQIAALFQRLGADGNAIAAPGELPEHWAAALQARGAVGPPRGGMGGEEPSRGGNGGARSSPVRRGGRGVTGGRAPLCSGGSGGIAPPDDKHCSLAHLTGVLPPVDGVTITLAGLITRAGQGTTLFGAMHPRPDPDVRVGGPSLWLTDGDGWHTVSVSGWSSHGDGYTFQADIVPPLTPAVAEVEVRVTGTDAEARATLPVTWWNS